MSIVVLCEKPSVAKQISAGLSKMIGKTASKGDGFFEVGDYSITWAYGHLLQNDIQASFGPFHMYPVFPKDWVYTPVQGMTDSAKNSRAQLKKIYALLKSASEIVIATDPGREGELIARLIIDHSPVGKKKLPLKRVWVSESLEDPAVVIDAFKNLKPGSDFDTLHMEAVARQHADGDVGINLSRALNAKVNDGDKWSIGRVKTPVTCIVAKREDEINNFVKTNYHVLSAEFGSGKDTYPGRYTLQKAAVTDEDSDDDFNSEQQGSRLTKQDIDKLTQKLKPGEVCEIISVDATKKVEPPPLLHTITTFQVEVLKELKIKSMVSSKLLQDLYDRGFVSYPRTESKYLGTKNAPLIAKILTSLGQPQLAAKVNPNNKRVFDDSKLTDHHALIPLKSGNSLTGDEKKVYDIIHRSFIAAFSPNAIKTTFKIVTEAAGEKFVTNGTQDEDLGWKTLYGIQGKKYSFSLQKGTKVELKRLLPESKETLPPPRYTEGTLLTIMENAHKLIPKESYALRKIMQTKENAGLGTGATRARILNELFTQGYLKMSGTTVFPEDKAMRLFYKINNVLKVSDPIMTAEWEMKLKDIRENKITYAQFISGIESFVVAEVNAIKNLTNTDLKQTFDAKCPVCKQASLSKSFGKIECTKEDFVLYTKIAGKQLTEKQINQLLTTGEVFVSGMTSKKSAKTFDAWVKLGQDGKTVFDFSKQAPETTKYQKTPSSNSYTKPNKTTKSTKKPAAPSTKRTRPSL